MKKVILFIILAFVLVLTYNYRESIYTAYNDYLGSNQKPTTLVNNRYARNYSFNYVQLTDNFSPSTKQDILNIYYTILNSGMTEFTFYCGQDYYNCKSDINSIVKDQEVLSNINNFVHPYNSFKSMQTEIDTTGKVKVTVEKNYTEEMIIILNYKVDEIYNKIVKDNLSKRNKIKVIHDYIIKETKYDKARADEKIVKYQSDNAYGVLAQNIGLCGGYTDAMQLFLEKMNIKSYRVASDNHIWNYVYLDNKWYHLDLTWDDPIPYDNGSDILDDTYFLINTYDLLSKEKTEHTYNRIVFSE